MVQLGAIAKRKPLRSRVYIRATVEGTWDPQDALIRDISPSGALVEANLTPPVDTVVQLRCGETLVEGRVAWVDSTRFGLEFNEALKDGYLMDQAGSKLKVSAPRDYRRDGSQHNVAASSEGP